MEDMNADQVAALRALLAPTGWLERTRSFARALRDYSRTPQGLLVVGTPADEPWHMAAHLADESRQAVLQFAASGFRDFTRIAASDPVMWRDIFLNNREALLEMLARFVEDAQAMSRAVRAAPICSICCRPAERGTLWIARCGTLKQSWRDVRFGSLPALKRRARSCRRTRSARTRRPLWRSAHVSLPMPLL